MESNEHGRNDRFDVASINRRKVLQGVGAAGAIGVLGTGPVAAEGDKPCFKNFECEEGTNVKIEFVEVYEDTDDDGEEELNCYFEEETDTDLITIDSYTLKEEGDCEPISVEWSVADGYGANKVMAYGGQDCTDPIEDPDDPFEPELHTPSGQTAAISNLQFCVEKLEEVKVPSNSYIGYEDRPEQGDFDYNDFGMRANITETYLGDELQTIDMEFSAAEYQAGDSHVISIQRDFPSSDDMEWEYELSRSGADDLSSDRTTDETSGPVGGSGSLEVALFDTATLSSKTSTIDDTVSITVTITSGTENPPSNSPRPDVAANNDLFEVYDTVMEPDGAAAVDLGTVQSGITSGDIGGDVTENWDNEADVPNIIVVPDVAFDPPAEATTISTDYPEFDDYYAGGDTDDGVLEVDDTYQDWFDTS